MRLFGRYSRDWFRTALEQRLPADAAFSRAKLEALVLTSMEALAQMDDHCVPTESLKPLVMSAVQEELSRLLVGWLQDIRHAPSGQPSRSKPPRPD